MLQERGNSLLRSVGQSVAAGVMLAAVLLAAVMPTAARAQGVGVAVGAVESVGAVSSAGAVSAIVTTIDGRTASGPVTVSVDGMLRVEQDDGEVLEVPLADTLSIERPGVTADQTEGELYVWLRSGTMLPASKIDGIAESAGRAPMVAIDTRAGAHVELPLSAIAALRNRKTLPRSFRDDLAAPGLNKDFFFIVKDGEPQRFSVTIQSIHDGKVHFDLRGRTYDFPLRGADGVAAIVFGKNTGFAPDRQSKPRVRVDLVTGEQLEGKLLELADTLRGRLDEGVEFEVPSEAVHKIEVLSDKLTWLASMEPKVEQTAAFDRSWPWTADSSPAGPGIILGGKTYARGLVLVPLTRLIYQLEGRFDVFEAVIGIDDRGGPQAHAIFRVLGDGKVLFESDPRTLGQPPRSIHVELNKCQVLVIEADFGKNFDLGDLCAFADARIVQR